MASSIVYGCRPWEDPAVVAGSRLRRLLDADAIADFGDYILGDLPTWDAAYNARTVDPLLCELVLDLVEFLPKGIGTYHQRMAIAQDVLHGGRCDAVREVLAELTAALEKRERARFQPYGTRSPPIARAFEHAVAHRARLLRRVRRSRV